jgi:hypothetical protein
MASGEWKAVPTCSVKGCYGYPGEYNTWEGWSLKYTPVFRNGTAQTFDSGDVAAIDDSIDAFLDAGLDFVIIDLTNNIGVPFILKRTQAFLLRLAERRAANATRACRLQYAFALSWYWSTDPATFEQQTDLAWNMFVHNSSYGGLDAVAKVDGKPLVVQFASPSMKAAWEAFNGTKDRFTVRWAFGSTPTQDP